MNRPIAIFLICFTGKLSAISDNTAYAIIFFSPAYITGAVLARNITKDARKERYFLIERGYSTSKAPYYLAGAYVNADLLIFGRYGHEGQPLDDSEAFKSELGARQYFEWVYGELGVFMFKHRSRVYEDMSVTQGYYAYSDRYETKGVFASLGATIQYWRLSIGLRSVLCVGLSTDSTEKNSSAQVLGPDKEQQARDLYKISGNMFLDFGLSI